jgi:hypothetical protein
MSGEPAPAYCPAGRGVGWRHAQLEHEQAQAADPGHDRRQSWEECLSDPCEARRNDP